MLQNSNKNNHFNTSTPLTSSGVMPTLVNSFLSNQPAPGSTKPKAYINCLPVCDRQTGVLLDEQFKFVQSSSGAEQVGNDQELKVHVKNNPSVTKSGYLYFYVSNELRSNQRHQNKIKDWELNPNISVYWDNLQVTQVRGPLLEETHYYPFGLTMAGISSKAGGVLENKKQKFQGQELASKEFSDGSGLEMYEFKWRMDDPQTGRFWQVDPLADEYEYNSPYAFSENKVTVHRELEGLEAEYIFGKAWQELSDNFRSLGRSIDRAVTYVTNWSGSTESGSKTIGNTTITNSTTVSVSTETSTNFAGNLDYIIRNNMNAGNPEPMTKTTTTVKVTNDQKVEVKTSKATVTNKTSVDAVSGNVSTENSVKVNRKGVDIGGGVTSNSNGTVSGKVETSVGKSTKGKAIATLTSGSNSTNLQIHVGTEKKIGKQTVNQSAGIKINF